MTKPNCSRQVRGATVNKVHGDPADAGGGDGRVQHDEEALHGQYNDDTGGDEDDDPPEGRDDNCATTREKNNKKDKAVKSKRSRIIRPKPEPKPNIRLPLKEAEVSFTNIRFRLNRGRIELPDFG